MCVMALTQQEVENSPWGDVACGVVRIYNMQGNFGFGGWLVERAWNVFQNATWAHACLDIFSASYKENLRISFWSRPTVLNCVRIETGFKSQAQIRAWVQISSRLLKNTLNIKSNFHSNTVLRFNCTACSNTQCFRKSVTMTSCT